jgi:hypothetical protein
VRLPEKTEEFRAESDAPFSYIVMLYEDSGGRVPDQADAERYWEVMGEPDNVLVTADVEGVGRFGGIVPYTGQDASNKCLLSPELEIIGCESGHASDDWAREWIIEDWADRQD